MYRLFIKGQKNKKKLTPEEAVTEIRKKTHCRAICQNKTGETIIQSIGKSCEKRKLNMDITSDEQEDEEES